MFRIVLWLLIGSWNFVHADPVISITENPQFITAGAKFFIDDKNTLTMQDARTKKDWQAITRDRINFGYIGHPIWIKISIESQFSGNWFYYISYPLLDYVDIFIFENNELISFYETGDLRPFDTRPINHQNFAFPFKLEKNTQYDFYLKVSSQGTTDLPIWIMSKEELEKEINSHEFIRGWVNGICIIMLFYNLIIYLFTREKVYLFYIANVASFIGLLYVYDGSAFQYFWPNSPEYNTHTFPFFMGLLLITQFLFTIVFLNLWDGKAWYTKLVRGTMYGLIVLPFLGIVFDYNTAVPIQVITAIYINTLGLIFGFYFFIKGDKSVYFFIIAWSFFLIGLMVANLRGFGLMPSNIFVDYSYQISAFFEITLLSIALAKRIQETQKSIITLQDQNIESLEEYQNLYNNSLSGHFKSDMVGKFISTNPAFDTMFNPNNKWEDITDHNIIEILTNKHDIREIKPILLSRKSLINHEIQLTNNEGITHWYSLSVRPNSTKAENHTHFEGSIIDINESKENEVIKEKSLQERMTTLEQLSIGISHEINTPLGISITGSSYILNLINEINQEVESNSLTKTQLLNRIDQAKESIDLIDNGLNRVSELVKQLKLVSVNQYGFSIYEESIEVCIKNAYKAMPNSYKDVKVSIICETEIILKSYCRALEVIISELIENSVTHSFEQPDEENEITISLLEKGNDIIIDYQDNGIGIDLEKIPELFNAFYTTKRGTHGRIGLGLYQVYNLVSQLLKGKIELIPGPHIHYLITLPSNVKLQEIEKSPL